MRTLLVSFAITLYLHTAVAQSGAPPDKPQTVAGNKAIEAYERAIAPYVAKARASYPAAKKRYLAGLPPKYEFTVWTRLCEGGGICEDIYVVVDKIKERKIYGRVNNRPIGLKRYRFGTRVRFPESRVRNWVIVRPDGSEEANELGNFLDRWRPPKS
jgi:uncharacterized protein YegJ (DUF2314 family)